MNLRAVFSDIDGTLVHYAPKLVLQGYELVRDVGHHDADDPTAHLHHPRVVRWRHVPTGAVIETRPVPSATLGGGFISIATLQLVARLRDECGVKFCLLTGARTSTFLARCGSGTLPAFDFGVCEGGGKIFTPRLDGIDEAWLDRFAPAIGPWRANAALPPERRTGPLWDCFRRLQSDPQLRGVLSLDAKSYDSAFMVDIAKRKRPESVVGVAAVSDAERQVKALVAREFGAQLTIVMNLGKGHVSAAGCTKRQVVDYLCETHFGFVPTLLAASASTSSTQHKLPSGAVAALFDDENDLDFVKVCDVGFAPSIAHPAVEAFLAAQPPAPRRRHNRCPVDGFLGTEWALRQLIGLAAPSKGAKL